jgi:hypothetical protein
MVTELFWLPFDHMANHSNLMTKYACVRQLRATKNGLGPCLFRFKWVVQYKTFLIVNTFFFDMLRFCLLLWIDVTHVSQESGTFLEGGQVHNATCENNYVLDFIAETLEDPNIFYVIN